MRLLFFGTYDVSAHPRVAVLRDGLRDRGALVVECNAPLGLSTAARVAMLRHPWTLSRLGWLLASRWAVLVARSARYRRPGAEPDAVVVGYLGHFDVLLARRLFPDRPLVLDHLVGASDTATDRGVSAGLRLRLLRRLDELALQAADVVVVDTDEHRDALSPVHRSRAVVAAVGAQREWYDAGGRAADHRVPGAEHTAESTASGRVQGVLRVVFFGLFTPLQGAPVIGAALAGLRDDPVEVTMVGTGQDLEETRRLAAPNPRVRWEDWVAPADLPSLVAGHDVCLGIFGTGAKARRVVPTKVFQGAAAGCAVVTSDTPPQRRLLDGTGLLVPPGDAAALAGCLRELASDPARLELARAGARRLALDAFAPAQVVAAVHDRLLAVVPPDALSSAGRGLEHP